MLAPTALAALVAAVYVLVSPPSLDLAAHLFRARLFAEEGFGVWDLFWYGGHALPGYSVLFPAASAALTPQLAAALASVATAPVFTALAWRHRGRAALPGAMLFGLFTAVDLFTGRLVFAFGALPAMLSVLALDAGITPLAVLLGAVAALCSPVAALSAAVVAGGYALAALWRTRRAWPAVGAAATCAAGLTPILVLAVVFPQGGWEPFALGSMLPVLAAALLGAACLDSSHVTARACLLAYALAVLLAFAIRSPVGANISRVGALLGAPVATVLLWERRPRLLLAGLLPLLYLGVQAPVQNTFAASGSPETSTAFYRPLLGYLAGRTGPPFRIEIPFTALHWEADRIATHVMIARGWERQLDIADNPLFYRGRLRAGAYNAWLHRNAIRYVALPAAPLDPSARAEAALLATDPPFLSPPHVLAGWRVYAVRNATPLVTGVARALAVGPDWIALRARRPGTALVRVRWTPYWSITTGAGCVAPAPDGVRLQLRRAGRVRLRTRFALDRIGARSARCTTTRQ